jgi:hypothetical protein
MDANEAGPEDAAGSADLTQAGAGQDPLGAYIALHATQPGLIPELVGGQTVEEVNASVERAKAAYQRAVKSQTPPPAHGGSSPPPAPGPLPLNVDPVEMILRALK